MISPLTYEIFIVISKNNLTQNCVRFECRLPCTCIVEYLVDYIYTTLILLVMGFSVILIPSSAALLYYYTGVPVYLFLLFLYIYIYICKLANKYMYMICNINILFLWKYFLLKHLSKMNNGLNCSSSILWHTEVDFNTKHIQYFWLISMFSLMNEKLK